MRSFHPPPPTSRLIEDLGQGARRRAIKIAGETGIASIYGFAGDKTAGGNKTANGEKIRATDMSAAHKSIPFGTTRACHQSGERIVGRRPHQ